MKRLLTAILSVAAAAIYLSAATPQRKAISMSTGEEVPVEEIVPTSCVIDTIADGVTVSYHIENILLEPDSLYAGSYKCIISDFVNSDIEGAPAFPLRRDFIEIPFGCSSPTLTITKASFIDIPCEMAPAYPFYIGSKLPVFTREHVLPINECDFGSQSDIVKINEISNYMDKAYVSLTVNPCQYNSVDKIMRVYTAFKYRIDYGPVDQQKVALRNAAITKLNAKSQAALVKSKFSLIDSLAKPIIPVIDAPYYPAIGDDTRFVYKYYLIITSDKCLEAAKEFSAFKRKLGFITHVSSCAKWTPSQIQDTINSYNRNVVVAQQVFENTFHVLLIGSHADVPAQKTVSLVLNTSTMQKEEKSYITDYYYSCLNGRNSKSVKLGRLPVNTNEEAKTVITKIKNYTMTPPENEEFYHSAAHIAEYDGFNAEFHLHVSYSEICRDTIISRRPDMNITRLYWARDDADPQHYGADHSDKQFPDELRRPNYSWDTDKYDIAEEINKGCFYALYRGHGDTTKYINPHLTSQDIENGIFQNGNKLPVFFNFTCFTGKFEHPGSLAETLLINPAGGGIGVFAATTETHCQTNDALTKAMLFKLIKRKDEPHANHDLYARFWSSELGMMFDNAFVYNQELAPETLSFHQMTYHLFGDPSMPVWIERPREYTTDEVWCLPHYDNSTHELKYVEVLINLPDEEGCYIAIEDKNTHETTLVYGSNASFPDFNPQTHSMVIYGLNRIPLEIDAPYSGTTIYNQEECLAFTPNPARSTCLIGYHNPSYDNLTGTQGILSVANISTGKTMDEILVKGHLGRIELDVSKYPDGMYSVMLRSVPTLGNSFTRILGRGKLIVQH